MTAVADQISNAMLAELRAMPAAEFHAFFAELLPEEAEPLAEAYFSRYRPSLHEFVAQAWHVLMPDEPFIDGRHIAAICEHLQAISEGRLTNDLIVNLPPGHCKSLLVSILWPAWEWGPLGNTQSDWMFLSHSDELAGKHSGLRRDLLESEWFQTLWPLAFKDDQNRKMRYENAHGGWMYALTVGSRQGTGEHPTRIVVDDPHDPKKGTTSVQLEDVQTWWRAKMGSRGIGRDVRRVLVMQRVDIADLTSIWQEDMPGCVTMCLPLKYEPNRMKITPLGFVDWRNNDGASLWPEFMTPAREARLRQGMTPATEAAQLQQRPPKQRGGADWPADWVDYRIWTPALPPLDSVVQTVLSCDPSLGETETSDYCAFIITRLGGTEQLRKFYVEAYMERMDAMSIAERLVVLARYCNPTSIVIEGNGFQRVLRPLVHIVAQREGMILPVRLEFHHIQKRQRVNAALVEPLRNGNIALVSTCPGNEILRQQLEGFPDAPYDDGPDALAMGIVEHRRIWAGEPTERREYR